MKEFFIGMAVMYFITSIIIFVLGRDDIDDIYFYIFAPHFILIAAIISKTYHFFKYHNLKSMVYDYEKEKWFYCERKDFNKIENKLHQANDFCFETYNKVVGEFSERYRKCYDKNHINFNGTVNRRYTPKKVWKNFEKYS